MLLVALVGAFAQEQVTESTPSATTASVSVPKAECSGFISAESIPKDLILFDGADNDHHQPLREFSAGDFVYLRIGGGTNVTEGAEYRIVRRAMPLPQPESLTNDQVYALSAYILNLNGLIGDKDVMNAKTLPKVKMPNHDKFFSVYPNSRP